jgi:hypothetical protein
MMVICMFLLMLDQFIKYLLLYRIDTNRAM